MKIFIASGQGWDGAAYLEEILRAFGLCFTERTTALEALTKADPVKTLVILTAGCEATGIESFLAAGGRVVAIRPGESVASLAGIRRTGERDGPMRLRFTQPVCFGARGEPVWTLGSITVYETSPGPAAVAYLFQPGDFQSETIGIWECRVGEGTLVVYAYDPSFCIARQRQGDPALADVVPPGDTVSRAAHLHGEAPPQDTTWRPSADLHAMAFCSVLRRLLGRRVPVPRLWHIPEGQGAILLYSGDEDGGEQAANHREMLDLESFGGSMSLYVIPDGTSITRTHIEDYTRRGHTISVHPNLRREDGQPRAAKLARAEQQVRLFQEKFGQPVRTLRNHCGVWPGYVDLPRVWERLGVGMDTNAFASLYMRSPDIGPYASVNGAVPLRFVDEEGRLLDVFQQPTHFHDDIACHPDRDYSVKLSDGQLEWTARRILEDAVRYYHAPYCANLHPISYCSFARPVGLAMMRLAREFRMPIWSVDRWHDFWRARATWRITDLKWDGHRLRFQASGSACAGLWLVVPAQAAGNLSSVTLAGTPTAFERVEREGEMIAQVPLPPGASEVEVAVEYGS